MKRLSLCLLFFSLLAHGAPLDRPGFEWAGVGKLAIQDRGRIKPFDTFAMESVQYVTGQRSWKGHNAVEVVFSWLIDFDHEWEDEPFIRLDNGELKKALGLTETEHFFAPKVFRDNAALRKLVQSIANKERDHEKLSDLEKKAAQLQNQRGLLEAITSGEAFAVLPNPLGLNAPWYSFASLTQNGATPYSPEQLSKLGQSVKGMLDAFMTKDSRAWNESVLNFIEVVRNDLGKAIYPAQSTLDREITYNHLRPFRWAWILYTTAFILLLLYLVGKNSVAKILSAVVLASAFGMHAYGFATRCLIAGRPPVTNMYESVIWVSWGCVFFSLLIWAFYKNAVIPAAASVFAIVGLVLADNLPNVLDPSIQPLEPVLRSNYWLTIHVLTITLSYAAFALSLCLGNVVLGYYFFKPKEGKTIAQYSLYMYRAMQIGVVLLAAGTILGGVWADYSWGRFWGWDPKEVWALIALLLYLAVLHGRFTGWLKGFGFVATTVVSFLGVLMAWYGVNFVLGVGLHSYGFGTGGIQYVLGYVIAQLLFIVLAYRNYAKSGVTPKLDSSIFPRPGASN